MRKLIPLMMLLLMPTSVMAQLGEQGVPIWQDQYCLVDNSTLLWFKNVTLTIPERNITRTIQIAQQQNCQWGCMGGECLSPPWIMWLYALGIVVLIVFLYLVFRPKD